MDYSEDSSKGKIEHDRELLRCLASTSLKTKLEHELADKIADAVVDAMQCIVPDDTSQSPVDLNMVEIMETTLPDKYAAMGAMPTEFHRSISHLYPDIERQVMPLSNQ